MTRASGSDLDVHRTAVRGCLEACRRCEALVDKICASAEGTTAYRAIGPHLRHCLDHFSCLMRGVPEGLVDYDARDRSPDLERDSDCFAGAMAAITAWLESLSDATLGGSLQVRQAADAGGEAVVVQSNLARELVFLSGHTIHHLAIMKLLAEARGVLVPDSLDIAFSTEAYLEKAD